MRQNRTIRACLLSFVLLLAMTACGTGDNDIPAETGPMMFRIPLDSNYSHFWVVDQDGNTMEEETQLYTLYDLITGEPQCQYRSEMRATGEKTEWGEPSALEYAALYDLEGNLLHDWDAVWYQAGIGNCVLRQESINYLSEAMAEGRVTSYWDFTTGEDVVPGANNVVLYQEDKLLLTDVWGSPLGVLNQDGSTHSGFPSPATYYSASVWGDYIIASPKNKEKLFQDPDFDYESFQDETVLLNDKLEKIMEGEWISGIYNGGLKDVFQLTDDGSSAVVSPAGEVIYQVPEEHSLDYYDGELAILQNNEDDTWQYKLVDVKNGAELAADYTSFTMNVDYSGDMDVKADSFLGMKDHTVDLIGRDGKVSHSAQIPGILYISRCGPDRYEFSVSDEENQWMGLLDEKFNIVIPAVKYEFISRCSYWDDENGKAVALDVYQCSTYSGGGYRYDIVDADGSTLVEGLSEVYEVRENRIAASKGLEVGLMDWKGSWIAKQSIFNEYTED